MKAVNTALHEYGPFYQELDGLVVIKVGDLDWVYKCASIDCSFVYRAN